VSGEISQLEIEQLLITKRAAGAIAGLPAGQLDGILGRMRAELENPFARPPGPPGPPPPP